MPMPGVMQVILLLLAYFGTAHAHDGWRDAATAVVGDPIGVDLALMRRGVDPRSASVIAGVEGYEREGRKLDRRTALRWQRIDGPAVVDLDAASGWEGRMHCTRIEGHDPVPGDRSVVLYPGRPGLAEPDALDGDPPALVLASQDGSEFAFARLLPGDVVQVTEGLRRGRRTERIEVRRGTRVLSIERTGKLIEACYGNVPDADR
jgi:hypothetical protein